MNHCDHSESWASSVGKLNREKKELQRTIRNPKKVIKRLRDKLKKETDNANV